MIKQQLEQIRVSALESIAAAQTQKDMEKLAGHWALKGIYMDQVQDFTPTPMTKSSAAYYSQMDPKSFKPLFVEKNMEKKREQKCYFFKK